MSISINDYIKLKRERKSLIKRVKEEGETPDLVRLLKINGNKIEEGNPSKDVIYASLFDRGEDEV